MRFMVGRDKGRPKERPKESWESESGIVAQASVRRRTPGNVRGNGADPEGAKAACVKTNFNGETWSRR
jgi:hypothetical protein